MALPRIVPVALRAELENLATGQGLQVVADLRHRLLERVRKLAR
jgi:hypothetical protein